MRSRNFRSILGPPSVGLVVRVARPARFPRFDHKYDRGVRATTRTSYLTYERKALAATGKNLCATGPYAGFSAVVRSTLRVEWTISALGLLDLVVDLEQRHVHRDHDEADDAADEDDHDRLEDRREGLDSRLDLVLVEVRDLRKHRVERAGLLANGHHLDDHAGECVGLGAHRRRDE